VSLKYTLRRPLSVINPTEKVILGKVGITEHWRKPKHNEQLHDL
jgi:hypothetical protein